MTAPATMSAADLGAAGWVRVGALEDVPLLEGRRTTIGHRRVAVFRLAGDELAAIDATCPHRGGPLQDGLVADNCVTCPLHERRIDLSTGAVEGHDEQVAVHAIQLVGADVWVRVDDQPVGATPGAGAGPAS